MFDAHPHTAPDCNYLISSYFIASRVGESHPELKVETTLSLFSLSLCEFSSLDIMIWDDWDYWEEESSNARQSHLNFDFLSNLSKPKVSFYSFFWFSSKFLSQIHRFFKYETICRTITRFWKLGSMPRTTRFAPTIFVSLWFAPFLFISSSLCF